MKRNWELIRTILMKLESQGDPNGSLNSTEIDGYDAVTASYHMNLLREAKLIKAACGADGMHCIAISLTWEGHEFLDTIRRDTTWSKIKITLREKSLDLTIDAIKAAAKLVIESLLNGR